MHAGILIIGSLLWDNKERAMWRQSRLSLKDKVYVKVPIRYGRRSRSRGNTFTMTFRTDQALGQAVLVPCTSPIGDVEDLVSEAEALWKAEQPSAAARCIGASWGCIGILIRNEETQANLLAEWTKYFVNNIKSPVPPVDDRGILRIPWPVTVTLGELAEMDIILATATRADLKQPTVTEIADAWINQSYGHERYFFENVRHGKRTPEDVLIWRRIEEQKPRWLTTEAYSDVVAVLREEAAQADCPALTADLARLGR